MKSIQIRETPEEIYQSVVKTAKAEGRSVSQQALVFLAKGAAIDMSAGARRRKLLAEFKPIDLNDEFDSVAAVREDRSR